MTWIRLLGLPGYMYKRNILKEIGGTIGKVAKLNLNTDSRIRGHFARLAMYKHLKYVCLNRGSKTSVENKMQPLVLSSVATSVIDEGSGEEGGSYGP
ncbi:hypothetical protein Goklo_007360 [Gossypium klotzschianum]|uniref:DUF4283 domain-containing protein n=1 Tax=Gossypium klotzschianum TaxID=34286 RepID=A0A7J8WD39_9ROSI|nr:hypothetical protein [Gossypium klotzschianum]